MDIHAEAELFVLPESDGGRKSPFFSSYRPCISFDDVYNGLTINLLDAESLAGGDTGRVSLSFTYLPAFVGRIRVGMPFDIAEGARVVARGTITSVMDDSLLASTDSD